MAATAADALDLPADLAGRLRVLRRRNGWTQGEVSARLGRHQTVISEYERGTRVPPLGKLQELAAILNVPIATLAEAAVS